MSPLKIPNLLTGAAALLLMARSLTAGTGDAAGLVFIGSLGELRQRVLEHNWTVQAKMMEYEVHRRTQEAARGAFDPKFRATYQYEDSQRPNTVEQRRQLSGVPQLLERNHLGSVSLETLTGLGGKVSLMANISEFRNNLQDLTAGGFGATGQHEIVTFTGLAFIQPLLKDGGKNTARAAIRVAASETEQAWQDYRRQLMISLSSAELAFWNVHGAARQVEYMNDSVGIAEKIAADAKVMKEGGKAAPVEVAVAGAGLEERKARLANAQQRLTEAKAVVAGFCGASVMDGFDISTTAPPSPRSVTPDAGAGLARALTANPDWLGKVAEKEAEDIRAQFMKNQKLPQLDFKATFGYNGLGTSVRRSVEDITGQDFISWGLGLELTMPLGNREAKHRYAAALAKQKSAENALNDVRMQISNAVDNAVEKVITSRSALAAYYRAIALNHDVLNSRIVDQKEGKADIRKVLEAEEDLSESKLAAVSGLILHRQALLEYELATGAVLENRDISITKEDLAQKTAQIVNSAKLKGKEYDEFLDTVRSGQPLK